MASGRINLGTATRDELTDLVRRQATKLKELQNASALLAERDDRLASMEQTVTFAKQELAQERASHNADRAAMQEQIQLLSTQLVNSEETIAQLLEAQEKTKSPVAYGKTDRSRGDQSLSRELTTALDSVLALRVQRLEGELAAARSNLDGVAGTQVTAAKLQIAKPTLRSPTVGPSSDTAHWALNEELSSLREQLRRAHTEASECNTALARSEEQRGVLAERAHMLARELATAEWRAVTTNVLDVPGHSFASATDAPGALGRSSSSLARADTAPNGGRLRGEGVLLPTTAASPAYHQPTDVAALRANHAAVSTPPSPPLQPISSMRQSVMNFAMSESSRSSSRSTSSSRSGNGGGESPPWDTLQQPRKVGAATVPPTQTARVVLSHGGPTGANNGVGSAIFGGGATMSKLRRRIADLQRLLQSKEDALAARIQEDNAARNVLQDRLNRRSEECDELSRRVVALSTRPATVDAATQPDDADIFGTSELTEAMLRQQIKAITELVARTNGAIASSDI
jgi:hypothetical protein